MKLAIMQPYFFPYLGYFDLIHSVDKFIVYDTVQYIQQGWINRNRILHPNSGWQYISVPLKKESFSASYRTAIKDVQITKDADWNHRIIRQLDHYRKKSPYFDQTRELVESCILNEEKSISKLDVQALAKICDALGIKFTYEYSSEMMIDIDPKLSPQQKVIKICEEMDVKEYVNLSGGKDLYEEKKFLEKDIKLVFRSIPEFDYSPQGYEYIPNLSIIDLLMWNEPTEIKDFLDRHKEPH